jgi:hypothetical protein
MELLSYYSDGNESEDEVLNTVIQFCDLKAANFDNNSDKIASIELSTISKIDYKFLRKQGINVRRYKNKEKLQLCEITIKQNNAKRALDFQELNKLNLQRLDHRFRLQIPHGCVNWRDLTTERMLYGFIVDNDSQLKMFDVHRFRLMVDDIFVHDTRKYPTIPSIKTDSLLESVKVDLDSLDIVKDIRKTCSLIDPNCFYFHATVINELKKCELSMIALFRQKVSNNNNHVNCYEQLLHKLQLQINRRIKKEPEQSFRFKNDCYKLYLFYMVELRWLQFYFLRVFGDQSYVTHGKCGYAGLEVRFRACGFITSYF